MIKALIITLLTCISVLTLIIITRKSVFDKLLCINFITNLVVLLICSLASYKFNQSYIDIAMIYGLLSYVSSMAFLRFFINQISREQHDEDL